MKGVLPGRFTRIRKCITINSPADIPFGEVKLGELGSWLGRRSLSGAPGAVSRAFWRWQHKYMLPKKTGFAPFAQLFVGCMIAFYGMNYGKMVHHRNHKYHW